MTNVVYFTNKTLVTCFRGSFDKLKAIRQWLLEIEKANIQVSGLRSEAIDNSLK